MIHVMLKQHPKVTTTSVGEGEERHVVVMPRDTSNPPASLDEADG